jgi:hypothetical protein
LNLVSVFDVKSMPIALVTVGAIPYSSLPHSGFFVDIPRAIIAEYVSCLHVYRVSKIDYQSKN